MHGASEKRFNWYQTTGSYEVYEMVNRHGRLVKKPGGDQGLECVS